MHKLIYRSCACAPFSPDELSKLLARARHRNGVAGVSGMLIYHDQLFLQVLEGAEANVDDIYHTYIAADLRHRDIEILHRETSFGEQRIFGSWSMGFADARVADAMLTSFAELGGVRSLATLDAGDAISLLMMGQTHRMNS
jgi:hypothetical protein